MDKATATTITTSTTTTPNAKLQSELETMSGYMLSFKGICNANTISIGDNWEKCKQHCSRYECCFRSQMSCYDQNKMECDEYSICREYATKEDVTNASATGYSLSNSGTSGSGQSSVSPPKAEFSFKDSCTASTIGVNWETCKLHCSRHECCFTSQNSCYFKNQLECDEFYICRTFYNDDGGTNAGTTGNSVSNSGTSGSSQQTINAQTMKLSCSSTQLGQNLDDCGKWCLEFECCFRYTGSCYSTQQQQCDENDFCESVFDALRKRPNPEPISISGPTGINNAPPLPVPNNYSPMANPAPTMIDKGLDDTELLILAKACNVEQIQEDDSECMLLCQGASCCFSQDNHCAMPKYCEAHAVCENMYR